MEQKLEEIKDKYDIKEYVQPDIKTPDLTGKTGIILFVGTSGSGKSTLLRNLGYVENDNIFDYNKTIIENFSTPERGETLLLSAGLRSIPTWFKTPNKISNGEKHRAECALKVDKGCTFIDEFTSVVDRNTAKSLSFTLRKYFDKLGVETLYVATCHRDIIDWLRPDYIYDTDLQEFISKDTLRRPEINIRIVSSTIKDWVYFKKHHYLDTTMNKSVHCYTAYMDNMMVGFLSIIHGCGRDIKSYWRESRLVVLPEFQGIGIGKTISDTIASEYKNRGLRYFAKTSHPSLGEYRNFNSKWRPTSNNMKKRRSYLDKNGEARVSKTFGKSIETIIRDSNRLTYSHEYIGD